MELIQVKQVAISGEPEQTVDARELHTFLENGDLFANWIKDRISQYGFLENQDFVSILENTKKPKGGRPTKQYALSLSMAKELAMVERNAKGKQARQYFIECERKLSALQPKFAIPQTLSEALRLAAEQADIVAEQAKVIEQQRPAVAFTKAVTNATNAVAIRDWVSSMKKDGGLRVGEQRVINFLIDNNYLYRNPARKLRAFADKYDLFALDAGVVTNGEESREVFHLRITGKGQTTLTPIVLAYFQEVE